MINSIDKIIEKYFDGESSIQEENHLKVYLQSDKVKDDHKFLIPIFQNFENEKKLSIPFEPDLSFIHNKKPKVRFLWPKVISVAASVILLIAVAFNWFAVNDDTVYRNKYTQVENPEEALSITLNALGFLSNKLEKGTKSMSHIKKYEKTDVFKSIK